MSAIKVEWGPALIGSIICMSLYGVTLAQTVFYFVAFRDDTLRLRVLVSSLCVLDTFHIYLICAVLWSILLEGRVRAAVNLDFEIPWQLLVSSIVANVVTFIVQIYFAIRVWKVIGKKWLMPSLIVTATVTQLGWGIAFFLYNFTVPGRGQDKTSEQMGMGNFASSCACDIVITTSLIYYFWTSRIGERRIDLILNNLIILTINTGLAPCLVAIAALGLYKNSGSFNTFPSHLTLSKLHVNCALATLNARKYIRMLANRDPSYSIDLQSK